MNLKGRDLSKCMKGEDVRLLHDELEKLGFVIPLLETMLRYFGKATVRAVMAVQRQHGLPVTGVVDEHTARAINTALEVEPPPPFVVFGKVRHPDGKPASDVIVRAVDRDLRIEEFLGEATTDRHGGYKIPYTEEQFQRAEKGTADVIVRAFDPQGQVLAASDTFFNAPTVLEVDLVLTPFEVPELSEYEHLLQTLAPLLDGVSPAEFTAEDIDFLVGETDLERQHLEFLAEAARLARDTALPAEAFYGWGRQDFTLELSSLLAQNPEMLRQALERAIEARTIPAWVRESLDEIMDRLEQLRIEHGFLVARQVIGRLLDQETEIPLAGFTVRAFDLDAGSEPRDLGHDVSDGNGLFVFVYFALPELPQEDDVGEAPGRRLRLHVLGSDGEEIHQVEIVAPTDQEEVVEVPVPVPKEEELSPPLEELADSVNLELPSGLLDVLAGHGIKTLVDIRNKGGIGHLEGLPVAPDHPAVQALEGHASLSVLSPDTKANAAVIDAGFGHVAAVAEAPRTTFVGSVHEAMGDFRPARLQVEARARISFLNNIVGALRANYANGFATPDDAPVGEVAALFPQTCRCKDCEAAVSPLAYLAELLDYTVTSVKRKDDQNEIPITLEDLSGRFHQFFGNLPAACEEVQRKVRQVRICIEVLRRTLADYEPPVDEIEYRVAAYTGLLTRIGTSFEEVRLAQTADDETRESLAERLGIDSEVLDRLLLDPAAQPGALDPLTEGALEQLFGLTDTGLGRHPLSGGAKRGDEQQQITLWNLDGVVWNRHTASDGTLYVSLTSPVAGVFRVDLFRDRERTVLVASGERNTAQGQVALAAEDGSSLMGRFEIDFVTDSDGIELVAVPHFLSGRQHYLRALWQEKDWLQDSYTGGAETLPIIDPDLIVPDDLRTPEAGNAAFDLWLKRREWVDERLEELAGLTKTVTDEEGTSVEVPDVAALFERMYQPVTYSGVEATPWADTTPPDTFTALHENLTQGHEVDAAVARLEEDLRLTVEEFNRLIATRDKAERWEAGPLNEPVQDEEWRAFFFILVQAHKRVLYPAWIDEEKGAGVKLGPKQFWISLREPEVGDGPPVLPVQIRFEWQEALLRRSRTPHIDPDVVRADDLRDALSGQTAELWQARREFINTQLNVLRAALQAETTDLAGFDTIFETALGVPAEELNALGDQRSQGQDIARRLDQLSLSNEAFDYLRRIRRLAEENAPILDEEWDGVISILVQVQKRREFAEWREQERELGITLSPDSFKIPEPPPLVFPPPEPEPLPAWRASEAARRDWRRTLQSRIDQEQAIIEALQEAVSATEAETLPQLRDILIRASAAESITLETKAKWITDHLLIDAQIDGCQITTRVAQAIETLQVLLWSMRTGQLNDTHPDLVLDADEFDEAWQWLGSYETWRAAMLVFLYPENILLPNLRKWQTPAFRELVQDTRANTRLTPEYACEAARRYAEYFQDICNLTLEASVVARTDTYVNDCRAKSFEGDRHLIYLFATGGATGTVYYSRYHPEDDTPYAQSFWEAVPGLVRGSQVIGAAAYKVTDQERFIYLFARIAEGIRQKLAYTRFNLAQDRWDDEANDLQLPDNTATFSATVKQRNRDDEPPHLAIRATDGAVYDRYMNREGTDWDEGEWYPVVGRAQGIIELHAMIEPAPNEHYLIGRRRDGWLCYRLFGPRDDGRWRGGLPTEQDWGGFRFGNGLWFGGFPWPGTDHVYAFWRMRHKGASTRYAVLRRSTAPFSYARDSITTFQQFNDEWLRPVTGVSLAGLVITGGEYDGMNLLQFFTLDPTDYPSAPVGTPSSLVTSRRREAFENKARNWISHIAGKWERSDDLGWRDWKLADDMVRRFTSDRVTLKAVLEQLLRNKHSRKPTAILFARRITEQEIIGPFQEFSGLKRIVLGTGDAPADLKGRVTYQQTTGGIAVSPVEELDPAIRSIVGSMAPPAVLNPFYREIFVRSDFIRQPNYRLTPKSSIPVTPFVTEPFKISERLSAGELQIRRHQIRRAFERNTDTPRSALVYLEEAYYFVPVQLALQLQQRGHFVAALDWFRTVYDYSVPISRRKIYDGLRQEQSLTQGYERSEEWWLDPLNPHAIAQTRANAYTRFTLLSLVRCFLAFADAEFTHDTAESIPRARTLYITALDLLGLPELNQHLNGCDELIGELDIEVGEGITVELPELAGIWDEIKRSLRLIIDRRTLEIAIAQVREAFVSDSELAERLAAAHNLVIKIRATQPASPNLAHVIATKHKSINRAHALLPRQPEADRAVDRLSVAVGADFTRAVSRVAAVSTTTLETQPVVLHWLRLSDAILSPEPSAAPSHTRTSATVGAVTIESPKLVRRAQVAPLQAVRSARTFALSYIPSVFYSFCIPPNPIISAMRLHAELSLYKLRTCRNIAGDERQLEPYAAPTRVEEGLPAIGVSGRLVLPGTMTFLPTPYRYTVLIERAKQLVGFAQQIEAAFLSTLEKRDAEYYHLLKARQEMRLSRAGVRLKDVRVREAEGGMRLAELQRDRAQIQADHYDDLLQEGLILSEQAAIVLLSTAVLLHTTAAKILATGAVIDTVKAIVSAGLWGSPTEKVAQASSALAAAASTTASISQFLASLERRKQEWKFQEKLARHDIRIGNQQIRLAQDRVRLVGQERVIAEMQAEHAEVTANFLATKFTNVELYDWMSSVLEGVYSFFLQQASAMARLAENQLTFERQDISPALVQADYWEAPLGLEAGSGMDGSAPDRRGLTGSARLLQDIVRLDQYAFETDKRKLQLTKTLSLARLAPAEFQRFRESGVLRFNTPMEMFDRDFPGHYLRLIKSVRTSVIALIPPTDGIKATLSTTGLSRVVVGSNGLFQRVQVIRPPETVALSSPNSSTGLFELTPQTGEMLLPFEGLGVDSAWEIQIPKAANPFDYRTIADVLLTIEYTALNDFAYRRQVIQQLDDTISADRPFSFRQEFADPWYDLHNPEQTSTPMVVRFKTRREDFPPNIDDLKIQHVVLFFAKTDGASFEVPVTHLHFTEQSTSGSVGGSATSIDGIISTRSGSAASWMAMLGKSPIGEWELALPNTDEVKDWFKKEEIEDMLFVITYSGRTPGWPI